MTRFYSMDQNLFDLSKGISPIVDSWFLMSSPWPVVIILAIYLYFVLTAGTKYMENRKPYSLKEIMIGYNAYQVLFSTWLCYKIITIDGLVDHFKGSCSDSRFKSPEVQYSIWFGAWWYFFSKVVELLDTVFFILRKKNNQVTFLHVYHHTFTCFFSWCYIKYLPGEQGIIIGFLNSFTHVVMYSYYLIAALGPKYQKYLWWKRYMTRIQLTQFCLMLAYLSYTIFLDCNMNRFLTWFFAINCVIYVYLFSDFYRKAYNKQRLLQVNGDDHKLPNSHLRDVPSTSKDIKVA